MEIRQAVLIDPSNNVTGKFAGMTSLGRAIVILDSPNEQFLAIEVRLEDVKSLNCHWCLDKKVVKAYSFTMEQEITNTIPVIACPYCT